MPMPWTYRHASREWRAFLEDAKGRLRLESDNMAYTAIDGVFHTFRRRLTAQQGLDFASVLPSVPRAIFVHRWDVGAAPLPFGSREALIDEVQALRRNHNLTPRTAIEDVAWAVHRDVDGRDLKRVLATLPDGAVAFWHVDGADPDDLRQRIV